MKCARLNGAVSWVEEVATAGVGSSLLNVEMEKNFACGGGGFFRMDLPGWGNGNTEAESVELEAIGEDVEAIEGKG